MNSSSVTKDSPSHILQSSFGLIAAAPASKLSQLHPTCWPEQRPFTQDPMMTINNRQRKGKFKILGINANTKFLVSTACAQQACNYSQCWKKRHLQLSMKCSGFGGTSRWLGHILPPASDVQRSHTLCFPIFFSMRLNKACKRSVW